MSVIAWLFGLGALSVAFPFLFHLIRRTPTGQTNFSSLMFLKPSPPRLTKRSRLENWLLLLLRCGAILALALAFMRPFFRDGTQVPLASVPGRNVIILLDQSASMKRGELVDHATTAVKDLVDELKPQDRVALFAYDNQLHQLAGFPDSIEDSNSANILSSLKTISPSWHRANLGMAIATAADQLSELNEDEQTKASGQIFVVSDFQKTSLLSALQSVSWPDNVKLQAIQLENESTNASVQILRDIGESDSIDAARVRIRNSSDATQDQFKLDWDSASEASTLDYYAAPGSTEIFSLKFPSQPASKLTLKGDENEFDNQFYFVQPKKRQRTVLILGSDDPTDPEELRYYFQKVLESDSNVNLTIGNPDEIAGANPQIILVTDPVDESSTQQIDDYLESGGLVAFVAYDQQRVESFSPWIGGDHDKEIRRREKYSLLADIDFKHPFFAPLANAGMNDFTGIKFWNHAAVKLDDPDSNHVIAGFDDGSPAIWSRKVGNGRVLTFGFGWQPEQSQLAFSPKFVILAIELVELAANERDPIAGLLAGQAFELDPDWKTSKIRLPDGTFSNLETGQARFDETELPGIYEVLANDKSVSQFAVNMDPAESDSGTLNVEQLEAYGISLGEQATAEEKAEQLRAMKDTQLEDQQKIWKLAIVLALALIAAETFVASRRPKGVLVSELAEANA
jgi:hypothetical protein